MAETLGEEVVLTLIQCQHRSSLSFIKGIIYNCLCLSVFSCESDLDHVLQKLSLIANPWVRQD